MSYLWPSEEQLAAFAAGGDGEITMLNLLRYRDEADYSERPDETPCSGREAYQRYAAVALECVGKAGGRLVFAGAAAATVIGPADEQWDDVLLVAYPDRAAMMAMLESDEYQACTYHRTAALSDSRLVPLSAQAPA